MADDVNFRILDDIHQPLCILLFRASLIPCSMNASYGNVEPPNLFISQVKASFSIKDIDLASHQQPYVYVRLIIPFSYLYKDSHIERKIQHIVLPADIIAAQYD